MSIEINENNILNWTRFLRDITEDKRLKDSIRNLIQKAYELNRTQSENVNKRFYKYIVKNY